MSTEGVLTVTDPLGPFSNPYLGLPNPFPAQFPAPANINFPTPVLAVTFDPANNGRMKTPVSYNYNLSVEHQFGADWYGRVAYVGSLSRHLPESTELNPAVFIPTGSQFETDWARETYRIEHAEDRLRVEQGKLSQEELTSWLK